MVLCARVIRDTQITPTYQFPVGYFDLKWLTQVSNPGKHARHYNGIRTLPVSVHCLKVVISLVQLLLFGPGRAPRSARMEESECSCYTILIVHDLGEHVS